MLISVHLHTTLQRQSPQGALRQLEVQLSPDSSLSDLLLALSIPLPPGDLLLVVNGRTASADQALSDGDQVHLIPAISGGT